MPDHDGSTMRISRVTNRPAVFDALPAFKVSFRRHCMVVHPSMNPTGDTNFVRKLNEHIRRDPEAREVISSLVTSGAVELEVRT